MSTVSPADRKMLDYLLDNVNDDAELTCVIKDLAAASGVKGNTTMVTSLKRMVKNGFIDCTPKPTNTLQNVTITLLTYPGQALNKRKFYCVECGVDLPDGRMRFCSDDCKKEHHASYELKPSPKELEQFKKRFREIMEIDRIDTGGEARFTLIQ